METHSVKFQSQLETVEGPMLGHIIPVPEDVAARFKTDKGPARILCSIGGAPEFPCALIPRHGRHILSASLQLIRKHKLTTDQFIDISIRPDPHNGLLLPEEFSEVLLQDEFASRVWEDLKDGDKRGYIHYLSQPKSVDSRIKRALEIAEKIKQRSGSQ